MEFSFGGFQAMIGPASASISAQMIAYSVIAIVCCYAFVEAICVVAQFAKRGK